jgi:23S rRNA (uracil1939-C5)-methyltransferase
VNTLCRHFGICGGCTLQDVPPDEYLARKRGSVEAALARHNISDASVEPPVAVPPRSRRRAVFRIARHDGATQVGFYGLRTHTIVDMQECFVITPGLFGLVGQLRAGMNDLLANGQSAEVHVTEAENGFDIAFRANAPPTPARNTVLARSSFKAARITWNSALAVESDAPIVHFGKAKVKLPPDAFLQPTAEGEAALRARVIAALKGAKTIIDLFSGCGTFSLPLAVQARVHAVEKEQSMLDALAAAARATPGLRPVTIAKRDLFKLPVTVAELDRFDGVCLDPPRAGAEAQARLLAQSKVKRIVYVSCDAQSFARDARLLVDGGYRLGAVTPVDQFLWSSHIELVADFTRA